MPRTFLELQDEALHDDFDQGKYRARVKVWLNEARARIRRRIELAEGDDLDDITLVAGQSQYPLPADQVRLASAHVMSPYTELVEVDADDLDPGVTTRGVPARFALRGSTLIIDPPPETGGTLRLRQWSAGTAMSGDTDLSGIPEAYEDLLVTYARARLFRAEDDFEAANLYMSEFKAELAEARGDLQRRSETRRRQTPSMWLHDSGPRFVRP